jgi:hypothetical protein
LPANTIQDKAVNPDSKVPKRLAARLAMRTQDRRKVGGQVKGNKDDQTATDEAVVKKPERTLRKAATSSSNTNSSTPVKKSLKQSASEIIETTDITNGEPLL